MQNFIWVSSTMPRFRKNQRPNSNKTPEQIDGRTEGWIMEL